MMSCGKMRIPLSLILLGVSSHAFDVSRLLQQRQTKPLFSSKNAGIVLQQNGDNRSKLASAFAALGENDQYDAVLTGLCAKILDETPNAQCLNALQDPISLLQEMNARRVAASGRSLMALIDATVKTEQPSVMARIMSLSMKNKSLSKFGSLQTTLTTLPPAPSSRVTLRDGTKKTRQERLKSLVNVPTDDRASEVSSALAVSGFCGICVMANVFGLDDITPYSNFAVTTIVTVGILDNFYDALKFGSSILKDKTKVKQLELPEKESMPMTLGSGQVTGTIVRGLSRLISVDTERECQCEAAAFFAAYTLGLPCFAFRPNSLEAAILVVESMKDKTTDDLMALDPLLSNNGILKVLVWLMAPVAMESSKHAQLIVSDPREAMGLLKRLEERPELLGNKLDLWFAENEVEKQDMLKWAYAEADLLLRSHKDTVKVLSERLAGGAATMGDCVAVVENW